MFGFSIILSSLPGQMSHECFEILVVEKSEDHQGLFFQNNYVKTFYSILCFGVSLQRQFYLKY